MTEVCSVVDVSQFSSGHSVDKCGFYGVSLLKYAGRPGQSPTGSTSDVASWADAEYVTYDGPDTYSNEAGMTMAKEYSVIRDAGLHYQGIGATETRLHTDRLTADYVRAWLTRGYPVILAVAESSVIDQDVEGSPYSWDTDGLYHIIVATGYDGNALLCHDTANIAPDGVRPGPRRYDAGQLQMISATAVVLPWLQRPPDDFDALQGGTSMAGIPQGWHDDGAKLTATNGHYLVHGMRDHVLNAQSWDAGNEPLEEEIHASPVELHNPGGGDGQRQLCRDTMLIWQPSRGVVQSAAGVEIKACYDTIAALEARLTTMQAQLKTPPATKIDLTAATAALHSIVTESGNIAQALATLKAAVATQ